MNTPLGTKRHLVPQRPLSLESVMHQGGPKPAGCLSVSCVTRRGGGGPPRELVEKLSGWRGRRARPDPRRFIAGKTLCGGGHSCLVDVIL